MPSEHATAERGASTAQLAALRARVHGAVLTPSDDGYATAAAVWNRAVPARPAVVVRCVRPDDVAAAVRFARDTGLEFAARGGGYSPAGMSTCGGVVADLRPMQAVRVDPLGRTAVVAAGATWGMLDTATQRHGLAVPGVPVSRVGVAGSTINGGFGHLRRAYGLSCDALTAADLVLADGTRRSTSGDLDPELLWGLRGGGGNFGVVTSMRFRLSPLPEPVLSGPVFYPAEHATALLGFYRDYTRHLREDVSTRFSLYSSTRSAAIDDLLPAVERCPLVVINAACVGHPLDAERLVRPIRGAAPVLADRLEPQPYVRLQATPDSVYPAGWYAALTSGYVDELDDALIAALTGRHAAMPAGWCELHVFDMGGAVGRVARMSTAVPNRAARYLVVAVSRWPGPEREPEHRSWLEDTEARLSPLFVGGPHPGLRSAPASSIEVYGAERYLRLSALKRRYDPDNVFAANQNVQPLS